MKAGVPIFTLVLLAALPAAAEEPKALELRSKAAIQAVVVHRSPPFVLPLGEPEREPIVGKHDLREDASPSSCNSARALCYDPSSGRIVYKAARQYMPDLPGLQAESISLKRGRVLLRYSF